MAAFNKSNWSRTSGPQKMVQYFPSGIPNVSVLANSSTILTLTAARQFKGNGQVDTTIPFFTGANGPLVAGLSLGDSVLISPSSGSYAAGNFPRIQIKITNSTVGAITPPATDLLAMQS